MKAWVSRMIGRSVRDLAEEVDTALGKLAHAEGQRAAAQEALRLAEIDVARAQAGVATARDALFKEHPHLRGDVQPTNGVDNTAKFEVVEVDDADDPRFTGGVPYDENEPLEDLVWNEHD